MAEAELKVIFKGQDQNLERTADSLGNKMGRLGRTIATGLAIGGAAVAGLGAAVIKFASDAEPIAGVREGFQGLAADVVGGSDAMLRALQEASNGFVTNTDLMESFNKAAQLVGVEFAERLPAAMEPIGKVAAATGQDMGFLLDSLVTGVGRLSPMILDNLGIQVDLTQAMEDYAASVGKSADELTKTEQQTALMNQVTELLANNTANLASPSGGFAQLAIKMSNLKDEIGLRLLPVIEPLLQQLLTAADSVLPQVMAGVDGFVRFLVRVIEVLPDVIAFLAEWGDVIAGVAVGLGAFVVITTVVGWITGLIAAVSAASAAIGAAGSVIGVIIAIVGGPLTLVILAISAVVGLFAAAWMGNWFGIRDTLTQVWQGTILPTFTSIRTWIQVNIIPLVQALANLFSVTLRLALTIAAGIWQNVLLPAIRTVWSFIQDNVLPLLRSLWSFISDNLGPVVEWVAGKFDRVGGAIGGVSGAVQGVIGWINDLANALGEISLPEWMEPGSPTPWEIGLRGVADAMREVNDIGLDSMARGFNSVSGSFNQSQTSNVYNVYMATPSGQQRVASSGNLAQVRAILGGV